MLLLKEYVQLVYFSQTLCIAAYCEEVVKVTVIYWLIAHVFVVMYALDRAKVMFSKLILLCIRVCLRILDFTDKFRS